MEEPNLNRKGIIGIGTVGLITISQNLIAFFLQIFLARIISPNDFGILAFCLVFITLLTSVGNLHGDKFLIHKRTITSLHFRTVFTLEFIYSLFLYLIFIAVSSVILKFINKSELFIYLLVLGVMVFQIPLTRYKSIFERELSFKQAHIPALISQIIGGIIAIILAYNNFGIWSLIVWKVSGSIIEILIYFFISQSIFRFSFKKDIVLEIIKYGGPLLLSSILVFTVSNYDYILLEKYTTSKDLGIYWMAFQISHYLLNARTAINKVVFPWMAQLNSLKQKVELFQKSSDSISILYIIPTIIILVFGEDLVPILLGNQWLEAVIPLKIFFIIVCIKAIASNAGPLLYANGNTKADLILSLISTAAIIPLAYFGVKFYGIIGTASAVLVTGLISVISAYEIFVRKITNKGCFQYLWKPISIISITLILQSLISISYNSISLKLIFVALIFFIVYLLYRNSIKDLLHIKRIN